MDMWYCFLDLQADKQLWVKCGDAGVTTSKLQGKRVEVHPSTN